MHPAPTATARALRDALRRLIVAHGALDEARRPCGAPLPTPHAWALLELLERGPLTSTALSTYLHIDRTNVSRLCKRMEELGELTRQPHPEDGRASLLHLTPTGRRAAEALDAASAAHFQRVLERLGDDAPDDLLRALHTLTRGLDPCAPSPTPGA